MSLLDVFPDLTGLSLVLEFMPHTLYSKLQPEAEPLKRSTVRSYCSMLLQGAKYMHNLGIMHRVCYEFVKLSAPILILTEPRPSKYRSGKTCTSDLYGSFKVSRSPHLR